MDQVELPHSHNYNTRYKKKITGLLPDEPINSSKLHPLKFQLLLSQLFPSSYMKNKYNKLKKLHTYIPKKIGVKKYIKKIKRPIKIKYTYSNTIDSDDEDSEYYSDESDNVEDSESESESELESELESESDSESESDLESESESEDHKLKRKFLKNLVFISNKKRGFKSNKLNKSNKRFKSFKKEKDTEKEKEKEKEKEFRTLIDLQDNLDDIKYFNTNLDSSQKQMMIEELKKINSKFKIYKPYRILLLEMDIPIEFKIVALKKIGMLETMDPTASEYFKLKMWMDSFMTLPFNKIHTLPISTNDGFDKCSNFIKTSIEVLENAVFGLNDAKIQIMQLLAQWITNPAALGNALAIKGPMGTGKTTLIKEGISKLLNRPFSLIALGGATDASVLEGHSYTYEGSTYGKIVDILIQTQCSNPIIYFDELDKVSDSPKGDEIIGILTHLIDSSQNMNFHDKYFSEIDFDLSKALFIFSYNDETKINPILRDRMYRITTKGYDKKEKNIIAKKYLLTSICKQVKFEEGSIIINDDALDYIIDNYTEEESGVRNLKRCLEIIFTKLNLFRLMPKEYSLFNKEEIFNVEFPFHVTIPIIQKLIKKEKVNDSWKVMFN